ncbi:MAG TPA: hypothetical protein PLU72_09895 [Candidatus Ozemobacteraceae bacterium]|nr:hypothetical protein [Candidatus Ozemobacteraceae bacterium]
MSRAFLESFKAFFQTRSLQDYETAYLELNRSVERWLKRHGQHNRGGVSAVSSDAAGAGVPDLAKDVAQEAWMILCPVSPARSRARTVIFEPDRHPDLFTRFQRGDAVPAMIGYLNKVIRTAADMVSTEKTILNFRRLSSAVQTRFRDLGKRRILSCRKTFYFLRDAKPTHRDPSPDEAVFASLPGFFRRHRFCATATPTKWQYPGLSELIADFWQQTFAKLIELSAGHMTNLLDAHFGILQTGISLQEPGSDDDADDITPVEAEASQRRHKLEDNLGYTQEILIENWLGRSISHACWRLRANPEGATRMLLAGALDLCRIAPEIAAHLHLPPAWIERMRGRPNFGEAAMELLNLEEVQAFDRLKAFHLFCQDRLEDLTGAKVVRNTRNEGKVFAKSDDGVRLDIAMVRLHAKLFEKFLPVMRDYAEQAETAPPDDPATPPRRSRARKENDR